MSVTDLKTELGVVDEADVAKLRNIKIAALRNERSKGMGPPFTRIGKSVFYPIKGLREYMAKQAVVPSQPPTLVDGRGKRRASRA